jgi:hypothetical protein
MELSSKRCHLLIFPIVLGLLLALAVSAAGASYIQRLSTGLTAEISAKAATDPGSGPARLPVGVDSGPLVPLASVPDAKRDAQQVEESSLTPVAASGVLEVFTNTWSYSTIGLVYDPDRGLVRYAHESQSSSHNSTIYDVDPVAHTVLFSAALSTQNSGWPWQLDNRTGAGYDFFAGTYFLPDYNGDLSYADDNIVEVDVDGTILNAWEMDDEVGSNDSSDGSEIDSIIDIAVVPGNPNRYFATASYDGAVVYEIVLARTGTWWTPNSWATVMTYTGAIADTFAENLGIDYDAQNEVLYHSGWHTTTILVTDLNMNPVTALPSTFDCPGAGGYNSGVTFVEGSDPPEIWVTDFSSDQTTRCEAVGEEPPGAEWAKWVDGQPWDPDLVVTGQTSDTVVVSDVITAFEPFTLTEHWDPTQLSLVSWDTVPPVGEVITGVGSLSVVGPAGPPEVVTVTKWFHVQPCDWMSTTLEEGLAIDGEPPFPIRPVTIFKQAPDLWITSDYDNQVAAGTVASFTLRYGNTGGYENDVTIRNEFPIEAPIIHAEPIPDRVWMGGQRAEWDVGDLAMGDEGRIDVYVFVDETVPDGSTITIWDGILDHLEAAQDDTLIELQASAEAFPLDWKKTLHSDDNPALWRPGISVTVQTSQTLMVNEVITPDGDLSGFSLIEEWNPEELTLLGGWSVEPITYPYTFTTPAPGTWILTVPPGPDSGPIRIVKEFHAEPCNWTETVLWETLLVGSGAIRNRPFVVNKQPPDLWIDSTFDERVYGREEAKFVLHFGNDGGFENAFSIRSIFPAEAVFLGSQPPPTGGEEGASTVEWEFPDGIAAGEEGAITVTVAIAEGVPPSTTIGIWDGIFNHVDELADETATMYHVAPPQWKKLVNDRAWTPELEVTVQVFDTFSVTDVISTRSAVAMVEHWDPDRLSLQAYSREPDAGIVLQDPGFLSWEFPGGAPGTITLTKWFDVEPAPETYSVLWEELWVEDVQWERRPVHIDKVEGRLYLPLMVRR